MYGQRGLFDCEINTENSYEEQVFAKLHSFCDKLKPEDRVAFCHEVNNAFQGETLTNGLSRFLEIENFKKSLREVVEPFKCKIPKKPKTRRVAASDDEMDWL